MAEWNDLVFKAHQTVGDAQGYLHRRAADTTNQAERERLKEWAKILEESASKVTPTAGEAVVLQEPTWKIFSERLDLAQQHIQQLHEYHDYSGVELVVGALNQYLQVMAGPHGPGKGRPGWP